MSLTRTLPAVAAAALVMLLLTGGAHAWHMEDETPNEIFTATAGDPRVLEDAEACFQQTASIENVTCSVLYFHPGSARHHAPVNLQRPGACSPDRAVGNPSMLPVEPIGGAARFAFYSIPSVVQYQYPDGCDEPRYDPHRGFLSDVPIEKDFPVTGYWYVSANLVDGGTPLTGDSINAPLAAGTMPCLTVRMTFETGRFVGQGDVLAQGTTTKNVVSTPAGTGYTPVPIDDPCPDAHGTMAAGELTEVVVDLGTAQRSIPVDEGFVLGVQMYLHDRDDPDEHNNLMYREWNLRTSQENPARIVLPTGDTMNANMSLQPFSDKVNISANFLNTYGSYDMDARNIRVALVDERGAAVALEHLDEPGEFTISHGHDSLMKPVRIPYSWDLAAEELEPGTYTLQVTAPNWQHTREATAEATIVVAEDGWTITDAEGTREVSFTKSEETAGPHALVLLLGVLVAGMMYSSRRSRSGFRRAPQAAHVAACAPPGYLR